MSKRLTTIRVPEITDRQLAELASATGLNTTELITTAIDRMYREEINTMNETITISTGTYALIELAKLVASASNRGEYYDGEGSTHIEDWLAEGSFDGNETIESLAAEWDE